MSNQYHSTRSQLYWTTLIRIPSQIIFFVMSMFVTRILEPKDFGIMGITMMLVGYSNLLINFGLGEAIIQKKIHDRKILDSIFTFSFVTSALLTFIFFIGSSYMADFFRTPECTDVIRVMSFMFIITPFASIPYAILRRDVNFQSVSLFDLANSLLMAFVTFVLALNHFGYWALVYGQLIPLIIVTVSLCVKTKWLPMMYYNHSLMKSVFHFAMWNFIKTQLVFIAQHTDKFIIGRWLGSTGLGFYDKAKSIAEMPYNSFIMNINSVMFSSFSRANENESQLQRQFKKSLTLLSFLNFPIYLGLMVIAPYFVYTILGDKWAPLILTFQIMLLCFLIKSFGGLIASLNVGIGKYKEHTIRFAMALAVFTVTCFLLLKLGIEGIALSYLIFCLVEISLLLGLSMKSISLSWKDVFSAILPGAAASALMFFMTKTTAVFFLSGYSFVNMVSLVIIGSFTFCLYVLFDNSQLTKDLRDSVWKDLKNIFPSNCIKINR